MLSNSNFLKWKGSAKATSKRDINWKLTKKYFVQCSNVLCYKVGDILIIGKVSYQCLVRTDRRDLRDNVNLFFKDSFRVLVENFSYFIVLKDLRANCALTNKPNWFVGGSCGGWCSWLAEGVENTSTGLSHRTRCLKQEQPSSLSSFIDHLIICQRLQPLYRNLLFVVCDSEKTNSLIVIKLTETMAAKTFTGYHELPQSV